jgi:prevent-host-death family protein
MRTFTATHAKQNFGELIDAARAEDITIIKNGRPFVIVSNAAKEPELPDIWDAKRKIIESYFDGKVNRTIALKKGGYSLYRELLEDAKYLAIPMPRLSDSEIKNMSDNISAILLGADND